MNQQLNSTSITTLPDELIAMILRNNDCFDIIRFGNTCKQFYELVRNYQLLWKDKLKDTIPKDIYHIINNDLDKNWLEEVKTFYNIRNRIYAELSLMSPKCYWQKNELGFEEVTVFFNIALTNRFSYYYTIYILQELIRKANQNLKEFIGVKPYTLTEMYYARLILCHLMNTYLTVKWIQNHTQNKLHPEFVVNFFVQWVDSMNMHHQDEMEATIGNLVTKVELILVQQPSTELKPGSKVKEMCEKGQISERKVLAAITQVIYHQPHLGASSTANLDTLDIVKVIKNRCGHPLVFGVIYQAVARRCGVYCNFVSFPNHLFVEWRDICDSRHQQKYKIDLVTGELQPRRACPFSGHTVNTEYRYSPDSLLQYLVTIFNNSMGAINNWHVQNSRYLIDFMITETHFNPYSNFLRLLMDHAHQPTVATPIDIKNFHEMNRYIISLLIQYGQICATSRPIIRDVTVQKHDRRVKYAVGMICFNRKSEYVCVVLDWDSSGGSRWNPRLENHNLQFGTKQPFYRVVAADQSKRCVPQEHLVEVLRPTRLYHLEDMIGNEFSHFNGFAYVPNDEKRIEYPEDNIYVSVFQNRADVMAWRSESSVQA